MTSTKITFILIGICIMAFIFQQISNLWIFLSFFPAFAFQMPWTFISSIFLHSGIEHLLFNMIALFFFGLYLERLVTKKLYIMIFILSGIVGNLGYMLSAYMIPNLNPYVPGIGASGAIYGIMGTLVVLTPLVMVFIYGIIPLPLMR